MLIIKNGLINTMEDEKPLYADILINDGKIVKIAKNINNVDARIIDANGLFVYPGFIDAHSHIGIMEEKTGTLGDDCNEGTTPVTPYLRSIDGINPMDSAFHNALASGVTGAMVGPGSSNPIGGQFAFIKTYGRCIDNMIVLAPAAIKIAFGENPKTNYGNNGNMPATRMAVASLIRQELFEARDYLDNNKPFDYKKECYRDLFEGKIPLKAHCHRTDDILTAIRIAKEFSVGLTLDHCTEGYLICEEIKESGFPAIVGPNLTSRNKNETRLLDFKAAGIMHKAGIPVAITMDHPVTLIQYLPISAAFAAREGLGKYEALRSITIEAAKIARVDNRLGSIKVGKDADLAIFDGHPFDIFSNLIFTIVNGEVAWEKKE